MLTIPGKLFEAEMRAAMIETETREEVAAEMQERMEIMDRMYRERLSREAEENDRKTDEKMDLLSRVMRTGGGMSPVRKSNQLPMVTERTAAPDIVTNDENSIQVSTNAFPTPLTFTMILAKLVDPLG